MTIEIEDIIKAINNIEADIFDQTQGQIEDVLKIESSIYRHRVYFLGFCIWDSEDDERQYKNDEENEQEMETIEQCLCREIRQSIEKIGRIVL